MTNRPQDKLDPQRQKVLAAKLGRFLTWSRPQIEKTVGPYNPESFDSFDTRRREIIADCIARLEGYSDDQILLLSERGTDDPDGTRKAWRDFCSTEIDSLRKRSLPWYAGGFGHPDYVADFEHWCKMPTFTVDETLFLSIGVEPDQFTSQQLQDLEKQDQSKFWPSLRFLLRRREQLRRQFDPHHHRWRVAPDEFIGWSERVDLEVHPDFLRLLKTYHGASQRKATSSEAPRTDLREIDTMAMLFTAMVIEYYGYDPVQNRSPIPKEIAELAASLGLSVSDDTVRKYLKKGASFLPEDWKPE